VRRLVESDTATLKSWERLTQGGKGDRRRSTMTLKINCWTGEGRLLDNAMKFRLLNNSKRRNRGPTTAVVEHPMASKRE
jgi:hypothetical protein